MNTTDFAPRADTYPERFTNTARVVLPCDADVEWFVPKLAKVPREVQMTAFGMAMMGDLLVVMQAGEGKTLVGSMVAAAFQRLNPSRMSCFVVDRLPLLDQHSVAIHSDAFLSVTRMNGSRRGRGEGRGEARGSRDG